MADKNAARKSRILSAAQKTGNSRVLAYVKKSLLPKVDQAGEHAGVWLEALESDFEGLVAKPAGALKGFTEDDFAVLFRVIFGYDR